MLAHARTGACLLAVALGTLAWSPPAAAMCGRPTAQVFPDPSEALPTNGRIVIEIPGLMGEDATPAALAMELRTDTEQVALTAVETNVAADRTVQMVFVPARELRPRTTYVLYLLEDHRPFQGGRGQTIEWTTTASADRVAPRWRSPPKVGPGVFELYGCGDEVSVPVSVAFDGEENDVRVLAEVRPIGGAVIPTGGPAWARYLLSPHRDEISIGRGMCGGPFDLEPGRRYTVKLTAVDAAGNKSPAPQRTMEIAGPAAPYPLSTR